MLKAVLCTAEMEAICMHATLIGTMDPIMTRNEVGQDTRHTRQWEEGCLMM